MGVTIPGFEVTVPAVSPTIGGGGSSGGPTTIDLSTATLVTGNGVYNAGSSSLGETSSIVLNSGDPGRFDASLDCDYWHGEVTSAIDWETLLYVKLTAVWTSAPNLAYGTYFGLSDVTTIAANCGIYGGGIMSTGAPGAGVIGANPVSNGTGSALNSGGGLAVTFFPEENGATRFAQIVVQTWDAGFSDQGLIHRDIDPGVTMAIAAGNPLYWVFAPGNHNASLAGGTWAGLKLTREIVTRPT